MLVPFARQRPLTSHGGGMPRNLGLVLHVQAGNGSPYGWFNNVRNQVSSTWWAGKAGELEQYVDSDLRAWAQGAGNDSFCSVETEGYPNEALTEAQLNTLAKLYAWGHTYHGWSLVLSETPDHAGFGWHGMGGGAWGGHVGCPGDTRKAQRGEILRQAGAILGPPKDLTKAGTIVNGSAVAILPSKTGGGYAVVGSDGGVFAYGDFPFNGSMGGKALAKPVTAAALTPSGNGYWLLGADGGVFAFGDAQFRGAPV